MYVHEFTSLDLNKCTEFESLNLFIMKNRRSNHSYKYTYSSRVFLLNSSNDTKQIEVGTHTVRERTFKVDLCIDTQYTPWCSVNIN